MTPHHTFTDPYLQTIARVIERDGFAIQPVVGDAAAPSWSYTIGLTEHSLPEILTIGLPTHCAHFGLTEAAALSIAQGGLPAGKDLTLPVGGLDVCFLPVPIERWSDDAAFGFVGRYYGPLGVAPVSAGLQLVWPDDTGLFPWDEGFDESLRPVQPVLADGQRIPKGLGQFHPDCVECQKRLARARRTHAQARKRRKARKARQQAKRRSR